MTARPAGIVIPTASQEHTPTTSPHLAFVQQQQQQPVQQQQQQQPAASVVVHNGRQYLPVQLPGGQIQLIPIEQVQSIAAASLAGGSPLQHQQQHQQQSPDGTSQPTSPMILQMATAQPTSPAGMTTVQLMRNSQKQQQQQQQQRAYSGGGSNQGTPLQQQQQQLPQFGNPAGGQQHIQTAAAQLLAAATSLVAAHPHLIHQQQQHQQQHFAYGASAVPVSPATPGSLHGGSAFSPPAHHTVLPAIIAANAALTTNSAPGGGPSGRPGRNKGVICKRFLERSSFEAEVAAGNHSSSSATAESASTDGSAAAADSGSGESKRPASLRLAPAGGPPPNCQYGHSCPYRHGVSRTTEEPVPRSMCRFFQQGACLRDACPFFHGTEQQLQRLLLSKTATYRPADFCIVRDAEDPANFVSAPASSSTSPTTINNGGVSFQSASSAAAAQPRPQFIIVPAPVPMQAPPQFFAVQPAQAAGFHRLSHPNSPAQPVGGSPLLLVQQQPVSPFLAANPQ